MADEQKEVVIESRKDAIAAAIAVADKEDGKVEETTPVVVEKKEEEKKEEAKTEPDPEELLAQQGKDLMRALQDPTKARAVAQYLADAFGITKPVETKAEVKELKNDILEDLKEGLGEEFSIIADRLAPAIEKILNKKLEESQKDIRAELQAQETQKLEIQSADALTKLSQDFFGEDDVPEGVAKEMNKFMDRYEPNKTMTVKEYIKDAFDASVAKLGLVKTSKAEKEASEKKSERTSRNRNDASSRLSSERAPSQDVVRQDSKPMSRQEAIRAAIEAVEKG